MMMTFHSQFIPQRQPNPLSMQVNSSLDVLAHTVPYPHMHLTHRIPYNSLRGTEWNCLTGLKPRKQPCVVKRHQPQGKLMVYSSHAHIRDHRCCARRELCGLQRHCISQTSRQPFAQ